MKELFIVRTGDHDDLGEENLSSYGERQINRLAKKIRSDYAPSSSVSLLCSPIPNAVQSAEIFKKVLGLEGYAEERVFAGGYEISTIEEKIGRYNSDRIIVVTHEVPAFVYSQHMIKILGIDKKAKDLDNGECAYFNLEGKTYQILRHSDKVEADISI